MSSKINYMNSKTDYQQVPTTTDASAATTNNTPTSSSYAFHVADSAVRVVVDNDANNNGNPYESDQDHPAILLGSNRNPVTLHTCPHCAEEMVRTRTRTYPSLATWGCAVVTGIFFLPIAWLPFCLDSTRQTDHYCQKCNAKIGSVRPMEGCCVKEQY